jgi:hypothetical protein
VKLLEKIVTAHSHDDSRIFASSPMLNPTYHSKLGDAYVSSQRGTAAAEVHGTTPSISKLSELYKDPTVVF